MSAVPELVTERLLRGAERLGGRSEGLVTFHAAPSLVYAYPPTERKR